ncbi:MAG: hypothetical protein K8R68_04930 [Bacteroidales bacterium]|nr:hypothetical protein [Bacteroidales bacterium]
MKLYTNAAILLRFFLWLIAIHSFLVGMLLIILPANSLAFFGFEIIEKFFSTQGGVFHIVMSIAYVIAAINLSKSDLLIYFSIAAKFTATFFLFSYFIFKNQIWMVFFSGLGDFIMAVILLALFVNYKKDRNAT